MKLIKQIILSFTILIINLTCHADSPPQIIYKPILFNKERINLTQQYLHQHYNIVSKNIIIQPKMIVLHYTTTPTLSEAYGIFYPPRISGRHYLSKYSPLNVSAQYLVDRNGAIYQLMPSNWMARHVIGLDYLAIGIENVGGVNGNPDLTKAQIQANVALIRYLKKKYPSIKYLIGHSEYGRFRKSPLWLEKQTRYFTIKEDPGDMFMQAVRAQVKDLNLKGSP